MISANCNFLDFLNISNHVMTCVRPMAESNTNAYDGDEVGTAKVYHRLLKFMIYVEAIPQLLDVA